MKNKDVSVELLRIIAMTMVVGCHVNPGFKYFDAINPLGVGITCIVADGVAIFWMIMGFFLFRSDYKHVLKRSCKHVLIPMFIYTMLMFWFGEFLAGDTNNILFGLTRPVEDYRNLLMNGLLKWSSVVSFTYHFWYLYSYMIVILAFPALKGIVDTAKKGKKGILILFGVLFGILVINDIGMNAMVGFSHMPFNGAMGGAVLALLGYVIYSAKDKFENKPIIGLLGLASYFVVNFIRCWIQCRLAINGGSSHPVFWYTSFGVLSSYSLIVFAYGIKGILDKKFIRKIVIHVGRLSMLVYFVHMLVIARLNNLGVMGKIGSYLHESYASILLVQLAKMAAVLVCSLLVVEIYYVLKTLVLKGVKK